MHTWVILNPDAGSADNAGHVRRWTESRHDVVYRESPDEKTCRQLVRQAVAEGVERVAAAGGDGTVNIVVNAMLDAAAEVVLGVLPLGTGNDLAYTLGLSHDISGALDALEEGRERRIDVFQLEAEDETRYGVNVAAGGFSGQVDEVLTPQMKATWGPLAYILGVTQALPDLKQYRTYITFDRRSRERVRALNVVVANGRTAGGGRPVAPTANPCDGLLDVVIVKWGRATELAEVGTRLVAGSYLGSELVTHRRVREISVASTPGMWFNVDGELLTNEPVTVRVLPRRLRVVVGPEFSEAVSGGE